MTDTALVKYKNAAHPLLSFGPFVVTPVGLVLEREPTWDEWQQFYDGFARIEDFSNWAIGDAEAYTRPKYGEAAEQLTAKWPDHKYDKIRQVRWVAENVQFVVRTTNLSWGHHYRVAAIKDPEIQSYWLALAVMKHWDANELRIEIRNAPLESPDLPPGKYRVIYADPPWQYGDKLIEGYGAAELSADDAVLFLWATSPMLVEALTLLSAWGFTYKASFVWDKVRHNYGHYNSVRHEFLLVCTRGSCLPQNDKLFDSVQTVERSDEHSEKPEEFRQMIEALYPDGPRIELFARRKVKGWMAWGDAIVD